MFKLGVNRTSKRSSGIRVKNMRLTYAQFYEGFVFMYIHVYTIYTTNKQTNKLRHWALI